VNSATYSSSVRLSSSATCLTIVFLGLWNVLAQAEDVDPADRVARVSYLRGEVYTQTVDDDEWANATINQPLTSGDQLWTSRRGRAELQLGSTTLQIDADTQLKLLELSDDVVQIQVTQGVVNASVRNLSKRDTVEVDTPNAAVSVMESGTYRIEVADNDELTVVLVRVGSVDVASDQQDYALHEDERLVLRGSRGSIEFDDLGRMDEFDRWAAERNQRAERVVSSRYVGADVIGYEDLDDYGYWRWHNDYGYVWMPTRIVSGWAPYRYGHWAWVSPWGWTWIDDAPWGFAPFHYGRWTTIGSRWCWVPGPRTGRAIYAPALVAWIGTPGLSVSVNIGARPVGWIPLGPHEIYRPVYPTSHSYVVNVNISNSRLNHDEFERGYHRQPNEIRYANRNAASVVRADALRNARPVRDQLIRSSDRELQPLTTAPLARPERREQVGNQRDTPPMTPNARKVLARRQPRQPVFTNGTAVRPHGLRIIEPTVSRRNDGAGPEVSGNIRDGSTDANQRDVRDSNRSPETINRQKAPARSLRSVTTSPSIRADSSRDQRDRNSTLTPPVSSSGGIAPSVAPRRDTPVVSEPRIRNYSGSDELRSSNRQNNRSVNPGTSSTPQRGRSVVTPNMPAPTQREAAPAPNAPPVSNSSSDRRRDSQTDNGRQRGFRGDVR
jgi:Family of unknown function (DUF6600)